MDVRQLETFSAILATGSLTAAARLTGRSQPAVTRLVQDMEAACGFPLFDRNGPRITPTERALLLHDEVERALQALRRLRDCAGHLASEAEAGLHIAAIPALAAGLVPAALGRIGAAALPARLDLATLPAGEVVSALLGGRADLGFLSLPAEHRGLSLHWLGESQAVAVLPEGHPLAAAATLPLARLAGERLVTMSDPHRFGGRIEAALAAAGLQPGGHIVVNTSLNAMLAARAGLGIALVDPVTALGVPVTGLAVRPLDSAIPFLWGVATPVARPPGAAARRLIAAAAEAAAALPGFRQHPPQAMDALLASLPPSAPPPSTPPASQNDPLTEPA
ncbi:LysR family transcriptional regulator [Roseomonas sp. GC11]|uniref:LysR family transcriptional regulator n=1 Tax=Roseomonas sp. GC11 TaxID=2950546 RepID=UPI00210A088E|nr:LysR family transcriptional regulator [Roseomonas sp. GC11]MCQ4160788.1 LysR family transcriptional regulator [Roseomonas sp. GC11]